MVPAESIPPEIEKRFVEGCKARGLSPIYTSVEKNAGRVLKYAVYHFHLPDNKNLILIDTHGDEALMEQLQARLITIHCDPLKGFKPPSYTTRKRKHWWEEDARGGRRKRKVCAKNSKSGNLSPPPANSEGRSTEWE